MFKTLQETFLDIINTENILAGSNVYGICDSYLWFLLLFKNAKK